MWIREAVLNCIEVIGNFTEPDLQSSKIWVEGASQINKMEDRAGFFFVGHSRCSCKQSESDKDIFNNQGNTYDKSKKYTGEKKRPSQIKKMEDKATLVLLATQDAVGRITISEFEQI